MFVRVLAFTSVFLLIFSAQANPLEGEVCHNLARATCDPKNPALSNLSDVYSKYLKSIDSAPDFDDKQRVFKEAHYKLLSENAAMVDKVHQFVNMAKDAMLSKIESEVQEPEKSQMRARVQNIRFDPRACADFSVFSYGTAAAFYEPGLNAFTICPKLLMSKPTDATLAFIIGHELSHSIGPCMLGLDVGTVSGKASPAIIKVDSNSGYEDLKSYPYASVLSCLRSPKSANAQKNPKPIRFGIPSKPFQEDLCDNDQIDEAFCDWMSGEIFTKVTEESFKSLSTTQVSTQVLSIYATKCSDEENHESGFDLHPKLRNRAEGLAMANPDIRKINKCSSPSQYFGYCKPPVLKSSSKGFSRPPEGGVQ